MARFLIRLDDACPTMDHHRWARMFDLLDEHNINPIVGVVPNNQDEKLTVCEPMDDFWSWVTHKSEQGAEIAMHGYNHVYSSNCGGINPVNMKSEFAGLSLEDQIEKCRKSWEIFVANGIQPRVFFAPSHTFDDNTLLALEQATPIRIIHDTVALNSYRSGNFLVVPQQMGRCRYVPFGTITFCYHPNSMAEEDFITLGQFLKRHHQHFIDFEQTISRPPPGKRWYDKLLQRAYFSFRTLRSSGWQVRIK